MPQAKYGALVGFSINKEETILLPPEADQFSKITLQDLPRTIAGSSLNVTLTLNRLGTEAKLLYTVGRDHHSNDIAEALAEWQLDAFPLRVRTETPRTIVVVPHGDPAHTRQYLHKPVYDHLLVPAAAKEVAVQVQLCQPEFLVATGVRFDDLPLVQALFGGTGNKVLNPSLDLMQNHVGEVEDLTRGVDCLIVNHEEVCAFLGKAPSQFDSKEDVKHLHASVHARSLIVTWNSQGSYYCERSSASGDARVRQVPSISTKVVDPTGTGDVYIGAFLHQRLEGRGIEESMRFASAAAAVKLTKVGGSNAPSLEEVKQCLSQAKQSV